MRTPLGRSPFLDRYLASLKICLHSQKHTNAYRIPNTLGQPFGDAKIKNGDPNL